MAKQKIEIELEVPDGFEATGEYRTPRDHEFFLDEYGVDSGTGFQAQYPILRRVEPAAIKALRKLLASNFFKHADCVLLEQCHQAIADFEGSKP